MTPPPPSAAHGGAPRGQGAARGHHPLALPRRLLRPATRLALVLFGRLPVGLRRLVVRQVGCTYVAGAVGALERDGRLLLVRTVYKAGWGLPGGMLDRGEAPGEAVVREVREELGLDVETVGPGATVLDVGTRRLDLAFRLRLAGPEAEPRLRSVEVAEVGWFPLDALPGLNAEARDALAALGSPERSPWVVHGSRRP